MMSPLTLEGKVGMNQSNFRIRDYFLGWQCRIREYIMRQENGRPNLGICPRVILEDGLEVASALKLLLLPQEPRESILQFRFLVLKTHDPKDSYTNAVNLLSSTFYQYPGDFSGFMTGLFPSSSNMLNLLLSSDKCILEFFYQQQSFRIPCHIKVEPKGGEPHQFTFWHNRLFNYSISPDIKVLCFQPFWQESEANPPPVSSIV